MSEPAVSVCMIAYNAAPFIAQAVESALAQRTNFDFEVIVADDCSTDATPQILVELARAHAPRLRAILRPRNLGVNANLAATLRECRGKYVALLEGDDYWTDPEKLQLQYDALEADSSLAICFHYVQVLRGGSLAETIPKHIPRRTTLVDLLGRGNYIHTASAMFRNRVAEGFPPWFEELRIGDFPLNVMNARFGGILKLERTMAVYRVHGGGVFSSIANAARVEQVVRMYALVDELLEHRYTRVIGGVQSYWLAVQAFENGDVAAARAFARRRFATPPWTPARVMAGLMGYLPAVYRAIRKRRPAPR